ncbi:hypothetical protein THAOC_27321, partial [Thalassiosira oceanica]
IRAILEARGLVKDDREGEDAVVQIPDDIAQDMSNVSVQLKLRLHEAGEMIIPYQPLTNQKADCFRLVLAGKKDFGLGDIRHILDTMESLEKVVLHVDLDLAVRLGVSDAGKDVSIGHLVIIKEGLLGLVNLSTDNLSSAGGAGSGTARVRKVNSLLLGGICSKKQK